MVTLNRNDLPHILSQIRIAEDYMALINGGADPAAALAPLLTNPLVPFGLRTVDGAYSKFQPDMVHFGASDTLMTRMLTPELRDAEAGTSYGSTSGTVIDSQPRMISNLVADQSLDNPAAIAVALTINGYEGQDMLDGVSAIHAAHLAGDPGLPAFNSFFTIFGQFFDHGLDLTTKGGSGVVLIPLAPDDPLFIPGSPTNFMVLTCATNQPGPDNVLGTGDDVREQTNQTTPWVDLDQVYTSNASHQVFLREYVMVEGRPVATGNMLEGASGGPLSAAGVADGERVDTVDALSASRAFLDDIAHTANPAQPGYDGALLDAHSIVVDGRGNENVALTSVHTIFHGEHNRIVDFWIGGLAEARMAFGGLLGSTFTSSFENQLERLQEGDRFHYLSQTQGMNLLNELEAESFAELIRRNTDTEETGLHINGAAFLVADYIFEMDQSRQVNPGLGVGDPGDSIPSWGRWLDRRRWSRGPPAMTSLAGKAMTSSGAAAALAFWPGMKAMTGSKVATALTRWSARTRNCSSIRGSLAMTC